MLMNVRSYGGNCQISSIDGQGLSFLLTVARETTRICFVDSRSGLKTWDFEGVSIRIFGSGCLSAPVYEPLF